MNNKVELTADELAELDGPVEAPVSSSVESEEAPTEEAAPVRANRRETRRQTAHVPGPRRPPRSRPLYVESDREPNVDEEDNREASDGGPAQAGPEEEGEGLSSEEKGLERPMSFGDIDG